LGSNWDAPPKIDPLKLHDLADPGAKWPLVGGQRFMSEMAEFGHFASSGCRIAQRRQREKYLQTPQIAAKIGSVNQD